MALTLGPVIGTVGGATWEETPVSASDVDRRDYVTLMTVTPPSAESVVVVVIGNSDSAGSGPTAAEMWVGSHSTPVETGHQTVLGILNAPAEIRFQGGGRYSGTSSFTGAVFTIPFPG